MTSGLQRLKRALLAAIAAALVIPATALADHLAGAEGFGHQNFLLDTERTTTTCTSGAGLSCLKIDQNGAGHALGAFLLNGTAADEALYAQTNSTNAASNAVYAAHGAATGIAPAILGDSNSGSAGAIAVQGVLDDTTAGQGSIGIYGFNRSTTGLGIGVKGEQDGSGIGVFGTTTNGRGVFGWNTGTTSASTNAAVYGRNESQAVLASAVYGQIDSSASYSAGVRGRNGSGAFGGFGVFGEHAGAGIGVYGEALNGFAVSGFSPNNWSGYFQGNVRVVGNLQKNSGSFTIDHPLDPQNKYLSHSFVESPDMKNVYDGVVRTDVKGFATVRLPRYFGALNRSFRYQLTSLSGLQDVAVASKIRDNRFTIQSEKPLAEVSWQVTGIRKDAWANAHRIKVEERKSGSEAGKYLNPELYGKPLSQSVVYLPGMKKVQASLAEPRFHRGVMKFKRR